MAQVVVEKKRGSLKNGIPPYIWSYESQEPTLLDSNKIPAISFVNDKNVIINKDAVVFPDNLDDVEIKTEIPNLLDDEKIKFSRGRKDDSENLHIDFFKNEQRTQSQSEDNDEEESILLQKIRELVIRFERLLAKYLDPDIPTGRKDRKKFLEERELFRKVGYKDFVNAIDLKIDALCNFEKYDMEMFCKEEDPNWFKKKIIEALNGNFYSAQDAVNSVMQIVKNEEYGVPKRRVVAKIK